MNRKIRIMALVFLIAVFLTSCSTPYDYDLSSYLQIGDWEHIQAEFSDPSSCTEEEIDEALFQVMLAYADFTQEKSGPVELYNLVEGEYAVYCQGEWIESMSSDQYQIIVGQKINNEMDAVLSPALIGKNVGDRVQFSYTFSDNFFSYGDWAGKTVDVTVTVKKIYLHRVSPCTDDFVKELKDFHFETVQDLRSSLRQDILEEKSAAKRQAVQTALFDMVTVLEYPQEEINRYIENYMRPYKKFAKEEKLPLDLYVREYLLTELSVLESNAVEEAYERVKSDMVTVQLSRLMGVSVSGKEYKEALQMYFEKETASFEDIEEFEDFYTKDVIEMWALWEKVLDRLVEIAVPIH